MREQENGCPERKRETDEKRKHDTTTLARGEEIQKEKEQKMRGE